MELANQVISQMQNLLFVKDLTHRYIYCNEKFAEICGEDSPQACYGKTDDMLIWKKYAPLYKEGDIKVYQGQILCNSVEPVPQPSLEIKMLVNKQPLLTQDGTIDGVICTSVDVSGLLVLSNTPEPLSESKDFNLGDYFDNVTLSSREYQVLKEMLIGKTAKEIATQLSVSHKTIESYISRLKVKMQCRSRGDILHHAVISGLYLRLFPVSFPS
jgi:DNA-binding CsgD family transcriptional regulator